MRAVFSKTEQARYISHLDTQRTLERGFRRAGLPLSYTQGFNPGPRFSLASALMLGAGGENEVVDIIFEEHIEPEEFLDRTNRCLPPSIRFFKARIIPDNSKNAQALAAAARYRLKVLGGQISVVESCAKFMSQKSVMAEKTVKKRIRVMDARALVIGLRVTEADTIEILLDISGPTMKPDEIARLILSQSHDEADAQRAFEITRVDIMADVDGHYVPLYDV